jgi:hypothetical protein
VTTTVAALNKKALVIQERTHTVTLIRPRINQIRVNTAVGVWELLVKPWWNDRLDDDSSAVITLSGSTLESITDPDDAELTALQATFTEAATQIRPGRYRYRLDRVTGTGPTRWGPFPFYIQDI